MYKIRQFTIISLPFSVHNIHNVLWFFWIYSVLSAGTRSFGLIGFVLKAGISSKIYFSYPVKTISDLAVRAECVSKRWSWTWFLHILCARAILCCNVSQAPRPTALYHIQFPSNAWQNHSSDLLQSQLSPQSSVQKSAWPRVIMSRVHKNCSSVTIHTLHRVYMECQLL